VENIKILIKHSNKKFPLSEVNAIRVLQHPEGWVVKLADTLEKEGPGDDLVFQSGSQILRREVKCIDGKAMGSFNTDISKAANQVKLGGEVFVQVPEGTDALNKIKRFRNSRVTPEQKGRYRSVNIVMVDDKGRTLFQGPLFD
jgi:hypothetical protein